jgi:hypothetical protein
MKASVLRKRTWLVRYDHVDKSTVLKPPWGGLHIGAQLYYPPRVWPWYHRNCASSILMTIMRQRPSFARYVGFGAKTLISGVKPHFA